MTRSKTKRSAPTAEVSRGGESETQPCATCQKDVALAVTVASAGYMTPKCALAYHRS